MADEATIIKRGIWQRTAFRPTSLIDPNAFLKVVEDLGSEEGYEQFVRKRVQQAVEAAKEVLELAGHPIVEGVYSKDQNGKHHWIGEVGSDAVVHSPTAIHLSVWPYFLEVSALSIEEFSIQLIRNARRFLETISNVRDNWQLASMSLYFSEAMYRFRVEHDGISHAAEKAIASRSGRKKVNVGKTNKANDKKRSVLKFAKSYIAETKNSNMLKPINLAKAYHASLPEISNDKKEISLSTIRRYVDELAAAGEINFPTRAV